MGTLRSHDWPSLKPFQVTKFCIRPSEPPDVKLGKVGHLLVKIKEAQKIMMDSMKYVASDLSLGTC